MLQGAAPKMPHKTAGAVSPEINQKVFLPPIMEELDKSKAKIKMSAKMGNAPTPLTLLGESTLPHSPDWKIFDKTVN